MAMFNIIARLGFDGGTFQAGMARAERQVKGFAGGVAQGVGRAIAPWFGIGMFSRMAGMLKQFAENGDQIKKKWAEMGVSMDENVFNTLVKAGRQIESIKAQILSALAPILAGFGKLFQGMIDGWTKLSRMMGAASTENKWWEFALSMMPGPTGDAMRNKILGGSAVRKAGEDYDKEAKARDSALTTFFAEQETKKTAKDTARKLLTGGMAKSSDDLAKIGGFSMIGGYNDQIRISRQQLDQLVKIAMNTSDLKGIPS